MDLIGADKPAGVPLRDPRPEREGFVEYLSRQRGQELAPLHPLETEASGAVLLAPVPSAPDARPVSAAYRCAALVRGAEAAPHGAWQRVSGHGSWSVWEVEAGGNSSGGMGLPDLPPPGGAATHLLEVRLALADASTHRHRSPAPVSFQRLDLLDRPRLRTWLAGLDRRQRLFGIQPDAALRLLHTEDEDVRCDRFGRRCWFYWFAEAPPTEADLEDVAAFTALAGAEAWTVHWMQDRGRDPQERGRWASDGPDAWEVVEHGLRYRLRQDRGLSPGLFLDQRQNRRWVLENARGRRVLNLFAYTGGFGLCAAQGGAAEVASVDVAKGTLAWARESFALNGLVRDGVEFRAVDARLFLEGCRKRDRTFDLVVCDPPSFGRSREGVWKIDRDLAGLVRSATQVLAPGGDILVSTNYERWDQRAFTGVVRQGLAGDGRLRIAPLPPPDWDFELPGEAPVLKALRIRSS